MVARILAVVHHLQRAIDRGIIADRASVARSLGFTRGRVTQLLDLLLLAPDIQEQVLALEAVDGVEPIGERALRHGTWRMLGLGWEQRAAWKNHRSSSWNSVRNLRMRFTTMMGPANTRAAARSRAWSTRRSLRSRCERVRHEQVGFSHVAAWLRAFGGGAERVVC